MMRKHLVVGDRPVHGGQILPYEGHPLRLHGHRVALIGGRALCERCGSVGVIVKNGSPRRMKLMGAECALEGDLVACHCPAPQPLVSIIQHTSQFDDLGGGVEVSELLAPGSRAPTHFEDVFSSNDTWYTLDKSLRAARDASNWTAVLMNADSLAGYILGVEGEPIKL